MLSEVSRYLDNSGLLAGLSRSTPEAAVAGLAKLQENMLAKLIAAVAGRPETPPDDALGIRPHGRMVDAIRQQAGRNIHGDENIAKLHAIGMSKHATLWILMDLFPNGDIGIHIKFI